MIMIAIVEHRRRDLVLLLEGEKHCQVIDIIAINYYHGRLEVRDQVG